MKPTKKLLLGAAALLTALSLMTINAWAQSSVENTVKKNLEKHMKDVKIDSITKTPYSGLFEVRIGNDIVYTDKSGQYLFVGHILDAATHQDFTRARLEAINKIDFKSLPVDELAIKIVKGDGKRVFASFEDPNCGYCKRLAQTFKDMNNYTLYLFPYPILSEDSNTKVQNIWCAKNRAQAWTDWMQNGTPPAAAPAHCKAPTEKFLELGKNLNVTGTPTLFFTDGSRFPGAVDAKALEAKLDATK